MDGQTRAAWHALAQQAEDIARINRQDVWIRLGAKRGRVILAAAAELAEAEARRQPLGEAPRMDDRLLTAEQLDELRALHRPIPRVNLETGRVGRAYCTSCWVVAPCDVLLLLDHGAALAAELEQARADLTAERERRDFAEREWDASQQAGAVTFRELQAAEQQRDDILATAEGLAEAAIADDGAEA